MADTTTPSADGRVPSTSYLAGFEVYRIAIEFQELVPRLLARTRHPTLRDQLERASFSMVLNLAEGIGRYSRADKAHFYRIARGSALETAAAIDILKARQAIDSALHHNAAALLARVGQMLTMLLRRTR
jgi:four helix bundle protein